MEEKKQSAPPAEKDSGEKDCPLCRVSEETLEILKNADKTKKSNEDKSINNQ